MFAKSAGLPISAADRAKVVVKTLFSSLSALLFLGEDIAGRGVAESKDKYERAGYVLPGEGWGLDEQRILDIDCFIL